MNHIDEALARLPRQYQESVSLRALLMAALVGKQPIEDATLDVLAARMLDGATFAQLEALALLVGQKRLGMSDDRLRVWLRSRMVLNRASGTAEDILALAQAMAPGAVSVNIAENFPGMMVVTLGPGFEAVDPTDAGAITKLAAAAGIRVLTYTPSSTDGAAFTLEDTAHPGTVGGLGLGDSTDGGVSGGALATII
jgi:hypothetical protein